MTDALALIVLLHSPTVSDTLRSDTKSWFAASADKFPLRGCQLPLESRVFGGLMGMSGAVKSCFAR